MTNWLLKQIILILLKTEYQTDKTELENKIPDTSSLVKKTNYDAKIADIESKIPDVSNLATIFQCEQPCYKNRL